MACPGQRGADTRALATQAMMLAIGDVSRTRKAGPAGYSAICKPDRDEGGPGAIRFGGGGRELNPFALPKPYHPVA